MELRGGDPLGGPRGGAVLSGSAGERRPAAGTEAGSEVKLGMQGARLGLGCTSGALGWGHLSQGQGDIWEAWSREGDTSKFPL